MLSKENGLRSKSNKKDTTLPLNFIIFFLWAFSVPCTLLLLLSISCGIRLSSHGVAGNGICVTGSRSCLSTGRSSMCVWGRVGQFGCPPKWYEMKWEMEFVMAVVKGRRWGDDVTSRDVVLKRTLFVPQISKSVISNLILRWISVINVYVCLWEQGDKGSVGGEGLPNWLIAKVYMYENWRCSLWIGADRPQSASITCLLQQPLKWKLKCRSGVDVCVLSCRLVLKVTACLFVCVCVYMRGGGWKR
jgi:hypothetical protein